MENLALEHLKAIRSKLDGMDETLRMHTARFVAIEARLQSLEQRFDIVDERMVRMERRLELRVGEEG